MKRRDFLKTSAAAAGMLGAFAIDAEYAAVGQTAAADTALQDNRPPEYLRRARQDPFLPRAAAPARSYSIAPMPLAQRLNRKILPRHGFCSIAPGDNVRDALVSGNGTMTLELLGDPWAEQILFRHESLLMPWKRPLEAPRIADLLPQVRQLIMAGKDREAMKLVFDRMSAGPVKPDTEPHLTVPAFLMQLNLPKAVSVGNYLRTLNFESGEANVYWSDDRGDWVRRTFVSRPDNVVVQSLTAPSGHTLNVKVSLHKSPEWTMLSGMDWGSHLGINATPPDRAAFQPTPLTPPLPKGVQAAQARIEGNDQRLLYTCTLDPSVDDSGYAGVVRVVLSGGAARMDGDSLIVENASALLLLTRIEHYPHFSDSQVETLRQQVEALPADYSALLDRHTRVQAGMLNRVTIDCGGASQVGLSTEELLSDQRSRRDYSPALLEKMFEMGRYWFILNSGRYPGIAPEVNGTIDLQTAGAVQGDLREGMEAWFSWMESLAADSRTNARNLFGCRGAVWSLFPDKGIGVSFYYTGSSGIGIWPYWISAGGWYARHFWDFWLTTGDTDFLRTRVVPMYKDLALFYEDFLTLTDRDGNYIFVPSISPENVPVNTDPAGPSLVNATMDIAVCREVLTNLISASEILQSDQDSIPKWKSMLSKMPPYRMEPDGTLKEWAWPTLGDHYNHRHVSHLYGAWPGDEFDPDRTPQLARAALIADRRRTFDTLATAAAGETLAAYARCHRALAGARLKDHVLVDIQLRQLMEQGCFSAAMRASREPYGVPVPDAHGGIPALIMEMLVDSRPGLIEVLPALPPALTRGSVKGVLARTFARIDHLAWDMHARTVDLTLTSFRPQNLTLVARHGIEAISARSGILSAPPRVGGADVEVHLPENKPVTFHIRLGSHQPRDWVRYTESA
jgi:alpha-L-fucosidase 2